MNLDMFKCKWFDWYYSWKFCLTFFKNSGWVNEEKKKLTQRDVLVILTFVSILLSAGSKGTQNLEMVSLLIQKLMLEPILEGMNDFVGKNWLLIAY